MRVTVIGTGNVAYHLVRLIEQSDFRLHQIYGRNPQKAAELAKSGGCSFRSELDQLDPDADLYLIAVKDDAVEEIAEALPQTRGIVVHTSGSLPVNILSRFQRSGVFYPLQTFSRTEKVNWKEVVLCVEGSDRETAGELTASFQPYVQSVEQVDSRQRAVLHLAAVFACNFSNHMYRIAQKLLENKGLKFDLLESLITETTRKALDSNPADAQTGPALRGDQNTLEKHEQLLADEPELRKLYQTLTNSIQTHKK